MKYTPFWLVSAPWPSLLVSERSSEPPTELARLAVDSRRWNRPEADLRIHSWFVSGLSALGDSGAGLKELKASIDVFWLLAMAPDAKYFGACHRGPELLRMGSERLMATRQRFSNAAGLGMLA